MLRYIFEFKGQSIVSVSNNKQVMSVDFGFLACFQNIYIKCCVSVQLCFRPVLNVIIITC